MHFDLRLLQDAWVGEACLARQPAEVLPKVATTVVDFVGFEGALDGTFAGEGVPGEPR